MRIDCKRHGIYLVADSEIDEAYIEEVLGLRTSTDTIPVQRVNANSGELAYCLIAPEPEGD